MIPPDGGFDTARYGDRPFPVVPVDYFDRSTRGVHTGESLASKINAPDIPGSTFNLYQEMSYGQLFPNGTVPSAGIATRRLGLRAGLRRSPELRASPTRCRGATYARRCRATRYQPLYPERIQRRLVPAARRHRLLRRRRQRLAS